MISILSRFLAFAFLTQPLTRPAAAGPLPEWTEGSEWTVKSIYRNLPGPRPKDPSEATATGWSEPVYWLYRVKRVKPIPGGKSYLIQVKDRAGVRASMASIIVDHFAGREGEPELMALTSAKFYELIAGDLKSHIRIFTRPGEDPAPVMGDETIIPCAFPVQPLLDAPTGGPQTKKVKLFTISEEMEELTFARDVEQTEYANKPLESFIDGELTAYIQGKGFSTAGLRMVELARKFDGTLIKQVWAQDQPWFVYSEHPSRRSWLWEVNAKPAPDPGTGDAHEHPDDDLDERP